MTSGPETPKIASRDNIGCGGLNYPIQLNLGRSWGKLWDMASGVRERYFVRTALTTGDLVGIRHFFSVFSKKALTSWFFIVNSIQISCFLYILIGGIMN
jgi:hypothetical protein